LDKDNPQNDPRGNLVLVSDTTIDPVQSGGRKKLGETLTDQGIISKQELSLGLKTQQKLHKKRIGEILVESGSLGYQDIKTALHLKNSLLADAKLGAILVKSGLITDEELQSALAKQKALRGRRLGEILLEMGLLDSEMLAVALALQFHTTYVDLEKYPVKVFEHKALSPELLRHLKVFPIKLRKNELTVVVADPNNLNAEADLRFHAGLRIKVAGVSSEKAILKAIDRDYGTLSKKNLTRILSENTKVEVEKLEDQAEDGHLIDEEVRIEQPIIEIVNHILKEAVAKRVSDVHIIPEDRVVKVKYRIDGILYEGLSFQRNRLLAIINRMKIMADMDIAERRRPQDGSTKIRVHGKTVELRFSCLPTIWGQSMVIRLFDSDSSLMQIEQMGFFEDTIKSLRKCLSKSHGMLLFTGPTGSGKSTTIYSCLKERFFSNKSIITLENPVEQKLPGVCQVQIQEVIGLDFARGLRQILRHDPDVIVVGEIRDSETAQIGVRSALTGHLVISTLHTNSAAETFVRLQDMGVDNYLISSSLLGVVSQRLVRKICPNCKELDPEAGQKLKSYGFPVKSVNDIHFYRGKGCKECNGIGHKGRTLVYEFIPTDERIKRGIVEGASVSTLRSFASQAGAKTIEEIALAKAKAGIISVDEIIPLLSIS